MTELRLAVELYGTRIGELRREGRGTASFEWGPQAEERWKLQQTPLSHSIPVGNATPGTAESFFGGLLPEGRWLDRLASSVQVASNDLVGMLDKVGADLAGALRVGAGRDAGPPRPLASEELQAMLAQASGFVLGGGGSALAGFQRKLTLTRREGQWFNGNGTVASTHIIKPVLAENRSLAEGENYVLDIARTLDLLHFESWIEMIGNTPALVIERYDRRVTDSDVERIHQEDFAQALGLPWGGDDKFERNNPDANLVSIAAVLDRDRTIFDRGEPDRERLLKYVTLNVAVGNTDAHAKNFSLLRFADGSAQLAPFYDAAPLALAFEAPLGMAMSIAGEKLITSVTADHLVEEARSWGIEEARARDIVSATLDRIIDATRELPAPESIIDHVPGYIRGQSQNLASGRPARLDTAGPPILMPRLGSE